MPSIVFFFNQTPSLGGCLASPYHCGDLDQGRASVCAKTQSGGVLGGPGDDCVCFFLEQGDHVAYVASLVFVRKIGFGQVLQRIQVALQRMITGGALGMMQKKGYKWLYMVQKYRVPKKTRFGKRKNKPKPVVPRWAFLFDPSPNVIKHLLHASLYLILWRSAP